MATIGLNANEQNIFDDLDEFNFDDFDFDVQEPEDTRHPIIKAIKPIGKGIKDYVTNSNNIERFVKAAMPRGYGQAYELGQEATSELKQLYNNAAKEIKPVKDTAKSLLRKALPSLDGKIPKSLKAKLEEMSKEEEGWGYTQGDRREEQLSSLLTTIFEQRAESDLFNRKENDERQKINQGFEQIRHRDSISQLDAIRLAVQAQTQYQNKITYNVQKKQLELSYRSFWALAELNKEQKRSNAEMLQELKATRFNTALPDFVKQTTKERFRELVRNKFLENTREGMFGGAQDYFRKFARNLSDQVLGTLRNYTTAASSMGGMAETAADMTTNMPGFNARDEMISSLVSLPMHWLSERGSRALGKITGRNKQIRRGDARASHFVNTIGDRLHEGLTSPNRSWGSLEVLREVLANAAPSNVPESRMEVDSLDRRHEPTPFARSHSKSLNEIIPGLLSRIHREIKILRTGDETTGLITYDYTKNTFSTDKKVAADLRQRIAGNHTERAKKYADSILKKINRGGRLNDEQVDKARRMLIEKSVMGESIDIRNISNARNWGGDADGAAIADAFNRYLRAENGTLPQNDKSYRRQIDLMQRHRGIVGGIGDPRVLIQQMVNAGQLDALKEMGILDANNNLDRKVYAEWLINAQQQQQGPNGPGGPGPLPPLQSLIGGFGPDGAPNGPRRVSRNRNGSRNDGGTPSTINLPRPEQHRDSPLQEEILNELRKISGNERTSTQSTVEPNVQKIVSLLEGLDQKYMHASDANHAVLRQMLERLSQIASMGGSGGGGSGGPGGPEPDVDNGGGRRGFTSLWEYLKDKSGRAAVKAKDWAKQAGNYTGGLWTRYSPGMKSGAQQAWNSAGASLRKFGGKLESYYGDVVVRGEHFPRLRAHLLKAGAYRDKLTGRVITSLEDITGDVVDAEGNLVITMEEFYNSYVTGSLNKSVRELFGNVKDKLADWKDRFQDYLPGAIVRTKANLKALANRVKQILPPYDVYAKNDMSRPLLYANLMRYDKYFSQSTGKVIKHPRDIDGPVVDEQGNIVLSEEHISEGIVDIAGDPAGPGTNRIALKVGRKLKQGWETMRDAAIGLFGAIGKGLGNASEYFKNFFTPFTEMITNSGKTVTLLEKIHDMLDERLPGRKVKGDADGDGIRDGSIADIAKKRKPRDADGDGQPDYPGAESNGSVRGLLASLGGILNRKKKAGEDDEEDEEDDDGFGISDLADLAEIGDFMNGDGGDNRGERGSRKRRGAARRRLRRMRNARNNPAGSGRPGTPGTPGRPGGGRLGRLARWGMFNTDIVKGLGAAGGFALKAAPKALGAAGAAYGAYSAYDNFQQGNYGAAAVDAGITAGGVALTAGGLAGLAGAGGALLGGLGAIVASPFLVPAAAIAGVGALGYMGYKYFTKTKLTPMSRVRAAQYGVNPEDSNAAEKVFQLEAALEPHATLKENQVFLKEKDVNLEEIAKIFDVSRKEDLELFNMWYKRRFIPVWKKWLTEVRKIKNDGKLSDVESIVPGKDKLKVTEAAVHSNSDAYTYMGGWSQSYPVLACGYAQVKQVLESVKMELEKERARDGGPKAAAVAALTVATTTSEVSKLAEKALTDRANYTVKDKDGNILDASSMQYGDLREKIAKGLVTVGVATALPPEAAHMDKTRLDALTSIRFKAYGLTHMTADKTRTLGALEQFMGDQLSGELDNPKLKMSTDAVMEISGKVFGVPNATGEHAERWKAWFNGRFLPVFLLWAGTIRQKTGKTKLADAVIAFPMTEQANLARAIIGAKGRNSLGINTSVWNVTSNPWSDNFELNTDPDTALGNLEAIRLVADKVRLGEVTATNGKTHKQSKEVSDAEQGWFGSIKTKVGSWFGKDFSPKGEGANASGDKVLHGAHNAKPLDGMGESVKFGGGSGGNYTDLPMPSGSGWGATRDLIVKAAAMAGVDPKALIATIAVESGFNPNAAPKNPNLPSSAKGLGQHLDGSWMEDLGRDGKKFGIPNGTNQFDARASALMTAARLKFNGEKLQKSLGRAVTVTDLYLGHLMGLGGATKFLTAPPDAIAAEVAPTAAKQHPEYFYVNGKPATVKEVYAKFAAKLAKRPAEFGVTDADMKSVSPATSSAPTSAPSAPSAGPVAKEGPQASPKTPATYATTPSAGSTALSQPIVMEKGKAAVIGENGRTPLRNGVKYELILQREDSEEDGTYGTLRFPDGTTLNTLELPWKNNEPRISSIPPGSYKCRKRQSTAHGEAYELQGVPGRAAILIHAGNAAGSADKGMRADSQGCILLGMDRGRKGNQKVITASKAAMQLFNEKMGENEFTLIIRGGKNTTYSDASVNLDKVRQPTVNTGVTPNAAGAPQATSPTFTPTGPRVNPNVQPSGEVKSDLPRLSSTDTSMGKWGPTKEDMQRRDEAVSSVIAPKIDGMSKTLNGLLGSQQEGVRVLYQILDKIGGDKATPAKAATATTGKVKADTTTSVPVPQRRNV